MRERERRGREKGERKKEGGEREREGRKRENLDSMNEARTGEQRTLRYLTNYIHTSPDTSSSKRGTENTRNLCKSVHQRNRDREKWGWGWEVKALRMCKFGLSVACLSAN